VPKEAVGDGNTSGRDGVFLVVADVVQQDVLAGLNRGVAGKSIIRIIVGVATPFSLRFGGRHELLDGEDVASQQSRQAPWAIDCRQFDSGLKDSSWPGR
jgi:hypothetical protein